MYQRIAVALDSPAERHLAVRWGVTIARRAGCVLELVHVATPSIQGVELSAVVDRIDEDNARFEREARAVLDATALEIEALGVKANTIVLRGQIPEALDRYAH